MGEDRGEVALAEPARLGAHLEGVLDLARAVQLGEIDRLGHLAPDPAVPAAAAFTSHASAPSPSARNAASSGLRARGRRSTAPAGRGG